MGGSGGWEVVLNKLQLCYLASNFTFFLAGISGPER